MGVFGYPLGAHGTIVKIDAGTSVNTAKKDARLLVVLDRSGSMGNAVPKLVREVLPVVHEWMGYEAKSPATIIAFDSTAEVHELTRAQMQSSNLNARGGTNLAPALMKCLDIMAENQTTPYYLVVLSDGEISDRQQVLNIADGISKKLTNRSAPTMVSLIRAFTSTCQPDTQGLACFGQLNSASYLSPKDVDMSTASISELADLIVQDLAIVGTVAVQAVGGTVGRRPGESTESLFLPCYNGKPTFAVVSQGVVELSVNGTMTPVKMEKGTEEHVLPLLEYIESQIRQKLVINTPNCLAEAQQMIQWVKDVTPYLLAQSSEADEFSAKKLVQRIRAQACRQQKSILNRIQQLDNVSRVDTMNAARSADFLRAGLKNNALGRAVARRAAATDMEDPTEVCRTALKALLKVDLQSGEEGPTSFYSPCTTTEILEEVKKQFSENDIDDLSASDIMQMVGVVGVSYKAPIQACPDPWTYFIEEIYISPSSHLAQHDLWTARIQGQHSKLMAPGIDREITGVLPLTFGVENSKNFMLKGRDICQMHIAACMRDTLVRLPFDHQATLTAAAIRMAKQMYAQPSEAQGLVLDAVLRDLKTFTSGPKMSEELVVFKCDDPRVMMAGDLGVSSCGKPVATLFTVMLHDDSPLMMRAIYGYDLYKACSFALQPAGPDARPFDRKGLVKEVFNVRPETLPGVGELFDDPEVTFDSNVSLDRIFEDATVKDILSKSWFGPNSLKAIQAAREFFRTSLKHGVKAAIESYTNKAEPTFIPQAGGAMEASLLIQAVLSPNLSDRISKDANTGDRKYLFPDIDENSSGLAYLQALKEKVSGEVYDGMLSLKRRKEKDLLLDEHIDELYACKFDKFCDDLVGSRDPVTSTDDRAVPLIPNRDCDGYKRLLDKLTNEIPTCKNLKFEQSKKIFGLILGKRVINGEHEAFFCNGCSVRGKLDFLKEPLRLLEGGTYEELREIIGANTLHIYRPSDVPNRHGHCNSTPSFWALGFATPEEYNNFVGREAFRVYEETIVSNRKKQKKH